MANRRFRTTDPELAAYLVSLGTIKYHGVERDPQRKYRCHLVFDQPPEDAVAAYVNHAPTPVSARSLLENLRLMRSALTSAKAQLRQDDAQASRSGHGA